MTDFQRKKLFAAEADVWLKGGRDLHPVLTNDEVVELVDEFCATRASGIVTVEFEEVGTSLSLSGDVLVMPSWAQRPQMIIHELVHHTTPPEFPAHGAEFAELLLEALHTFASPALAAAVRDAFDARKVHYRPETRQKRVRRALVYAANNEPGVFAELILAGPPEIIIGQILGLEGATLIVDELDVGERRIDVTRGRYANFYR